MGHSDDAPDVPEFPDGDVVVAESSTRVLFYESGAADPFLASDMRFTLDGETCV